MSNLGLHRLLEERGIRVITTDVGDRYVLEALREQGGLLGGEQSGHIIYLRDHVTGDGLAAALLLCDAIRGRTLGEAAAEMPTFPQVKENLPLRGIALGCPPRGGSTVEHRAERQCARPRPALGHGACSSGCSPRRGLRLRPANSLLRSPRSYDESSAEASDGGEPGEPGSAHF